MVVLYIKKNKNYVVSIRYNIISLNIKDLTFKKVQLNLRLIIYNVYKIEKVHQVIIVQHIRKPRVIDKI